VAAVAVSARRGDIVGHLLIDARTLDARGRTGKAIGWSVKKLPFWAVNNLMPLWFASMRWIVAWLIGAFPHGSA
jgi:hypothetical protein